MITINAKTALKQYSATKPASIWCEPTSDPDIHHDIALPGMGGAKAYDGFPDLKLQPKFSIAEDSSFFTAGSCFARNVELALHQMGISVTSWNPDTGISNDQFHRYNTYSILNDFYNALEDTWDERLCLEIGGKKYADYSAYNVGYDSLNDLQLARQKVIEVHKNASSADVVILTLGLVEAWYDLETEKYMNITPSQALRKYPGRFELRITDFQQNLDALLEFYDYIESKSINPKKYIITVSPVPLSATFSGKDVIVANSYSKATLRSVAEVFCNMYDNVDYFPSYEIVTMAKPAKAWLPDKRHVRPFFIKRIMQTFINAYVK